MKKKLKLDQLTVESFITDISKIKGGESIGNVCLVDPTDIMPTNPCITETYHVTECGCRTLGNNCDTSPLKCLAVSGSIC